MFVFQPAEKLTLITQYLRSTHHYCIWCGTAYDGLPAVLFHFCRLWRAFKKFCNSTIKSIIIDANYNCYVCPFRLKSFIVWIAGTTNKIL